MPAWRSDARGNRARNAYRWRRSHVICPLWSAGVKLGSGRIPAVLSRRDGADDESSRRAVEGDGEEDHLVGGGGNHRGDGPDDAAVAGATRAGRLRRAGRSAERQAQLAGDSSGDRREGSRTVSGNIL